MKPLRLGFIGGGLDSAVGRVHYSACRMDGLFEVRGGHFSTDWDRCRVAAEHYDCDAFLRREDLLQESFDAIVVLVPTPVHYAAVDHCLRAGLPVICEKALAVTPEQSANLIQTRDQHNGFLAVTYNYTGYPMVRELRRMIQDGVLGTLISVQAEMPQEGYVRVDANPQEWRRHDSAIPALHLDLGTHLHHLIYFLTGEKSMALVAQQQSRSHINVVDEVNCLVRYNTFDAALWFSKTALGHRNGLRIRVNGDCGSAEWVQVNPEEIRLADTYGKRITLDRASMERYEDDMLEVANQPRYQRFKAGHPAGFIEAYANLYADFYDMLMAHINGAHKFHGNRIVSGDDPLWDMYSAEVAHEGLVMMSDMVRSAEERRWI